MLYRVKTRIAAFILSIMVVTGCSDKDDPKTEKPFYLNPPSDLHGVNHSNGIELRWRSQNVEKDFRGYYVFGANKSWEELRKLVRYPSKAASVNWQDSSSIPRCRDNNDFFAQFGLSPSDRVCEVKGVLSLLGGDSESGSDDTQAIETIALGCDGQQASSLSLSASAPQMKVQQCLVTEVFNGQEKVAFTNGQVATFFVVAVKGDEDQISWTSNFINGAGSYEAFSGKITLSSLSQFRTLTIHPDLKAVLSDEQTCSDDQTKSNYCRVAGQNRESNDQPTLYFSGDNPRAYGSGQRKLRTFLSTSGLNDALITIQPRGPATNDELNPGIQVRVPRAAPLTGVDYINNGSVLNLYGNQVFDLKLQSNNRKLFAKLVILDISYSETDPRKAVASMNVSLIVQPTANLPYYITSESDL